MSKSSSSKPDRKARGGKKAPAEPEKRHGKKAAPFPTKEQVLAFIRESPTPIGKREIARAFHLKGSDRIPLKALLKELERDGAVDRGKHRRLGAAGQLPEVTVVQIIGPDEDGDLWARPVDLRPDDAEPKILVIEDKREHHGRPHQPLGPGDRVLVRLNRTDADEYEARPIRKLESRAARVVGLITRASDGTLRITPADKRIRTEFAIDARGIHGVKSGEIVVAEVEPGRPMGTPRARVVERLGRTGEARSVSLIAIAAHGIPTDFPPAALTQAAEAGPAPLGHRTDLRNVPLVTIDGEDARDFDDAVHAQPDTDPKNPGGWKLLVAIADVAHYVREGDPLDKSARERGNSVYFPDRVVPMLPEELSNGWCSLRPDEDRPVMAVEIVIDAEGRKKRHQFLRGLMRSAARLTYERAQAAMDGRTDAVTGLLLEPVIQPLYGAFRALLKARQERGTLELDLPERRVLIDNQGEVLKIEARDRLDSHRLIEEFMIAANVAAAEALEKRRWPCMYRVHDQPDPTRVEALREFLEGLDLRLPRGQVIRPAHFTKLLEKAKSTPYSDMINSLVLRSQSQAVYSPENLGHFGLALSRYAHFTSPIRRYSDLLVHRALIAAYGFGEDGLDREVKGFKELGEHISATERRAAAAERESVDRYTAAFLSKRIGEIFSGRVSGVIRAGLFVALDETGADGIIPVSSLPNDFYEHDEARHALVGRRWGQVYRLGDRVQVRLVAAQPLTGGITFELIEGGGQDQPAAAPSHRPARPGAKGSRNKPGRPAGPPIHSRKAAKRRRR
ncbi:ribonuclease R [Dongia sedimenti]|uniref:Ribonuclease R n=1 Tax=Dongia sedimenti TaxID=3064282 RepID=A0ABU0YJ68_9PROT|nr:ribonuclease R [Rhodospirillaceae bacterium R-7]